MADNAAADATAADVLSSPLPFTSSAAAVATAGVAAAAAAAAAAAFFIEDADGSLQRVD